MFLLFAKFLLLFSIHMKHSFLRVMPVSCFSFTKLFAQLRLKLYPCSNFFFFFLNELILFRCKLSKKISLFLQSLTGRGSERREMKELTLFYWKIFCSVSWWSHILTWSKQSGARLFTRFQLPLISRGSTRAVLQLSVENNCVHLGLLTSSQEATRVFPRLAHIFWLRVLIGWLCCLCSSWLVRVTCSLVL